ncbi:hypothetical protein BKA67DRAFT_540286 [Truncatella angustata]|uniref:Uncharacterized protein n=1 Tax=Truncatella angustata TaxID=152316 RepID=A0A9P8RMM2_9PEZI|nr:uncharacterized protein BKA67DRAFT_540286 [Truncatella angustata]KAH6646801.1 hypothetical protein BKA67DRAFT_540286 [Truncatella angustata]
MQSQDIPTLDVVFSDQSIDVVSAFKRDPEDTCEALFRTLLSLPLNLCTATRIELGIYFRGSLQSPRSITPYRLHTIVAECKAGNIKRSTLEAKFFSYGGTKAVTYLAAATTDNKAVVGLLKNLEDDQLRRFVESIGTIEPHQDLRYIVDTLERKNPARLSKRKLLPSKPRTCKKKQSRHSRVKLSSSNPGPQECTSSEAQRSDTDSHAWPNHFDSSPGYDFLSELTHGPASGLSKILYEEETASIETHISGPTSLAFVDDTHSTTLNLPLMKRQQQQSIDTRVALPLTTQSEQSKTSNDCSQPAGVMPQETHISAAATYINSNNFEHYGIDLDMFNVL